MFEFKIKFQIHYKANFGQTMVVVGSIKELGSMSLNKGLRLLWKEVYFFL